MDHVLNTAESRISLLELGAKSTEFYFQLLHASLAVINIQRVKVDFERLNNHLPDKFENLAPCLAQALDACGKGNTILIPNITLHETLDHYCKERYRKLRIQHPLNASAQALSTVQQHEVVVLASNYSMQSRYIADFFAAHKINVRTPSQLDRQQLERFRVAVYNNLESAEETSQFHELVNKYSSKSAVLVACTELSLKLDQGSINAAVFDTARLQVSAALNTG